jgi:hypothetical protein
VFPTWPATRRAATAAFAGVAALAGALYAPTTAQGSLARQPLLVGAARANITPFTLTPELRDCRTDRDCPYHSVVQYSNPAASNPDGLPGGLFERIGEEMASGTAARTWIGPAGIWGEPFTDGNGNGRYDSGEAFNDDPANSSPRVGEGYPGPLGDPQSSTGRWDGVYMGGYGSDRVALGAFDPIWARAMVFRDPATGLSVAWVSLDLLGYFSDFVGRIAARLPESLDVDHVILTHTHDHESPDAHVGLWGPEVVMDGTYPRYEIYIEAKIAEAIASAAADLRPARFRFGSIRTGQPFTTPSGVQETLDGMMSRNSCRTPWFFDDELRAMQVVQEGSGETIATLLNWGAHVESLDSRNQYLSSDFPGSAREVVEETLGGVAVYTPAAQGASEIIGDSCTRRWQRDTFDGQTFPVDEAGDPLAFSDPDPRAAKERTYAIGRVVGGGVLAALEGEPLDAPDAPFEFLPPQKLCFPVNNAGLAGLGLAGVIDKPFSGPECQPAGANPRAKTTLYAFQIGSGSFVTAPGELFPEAYYGVDRVNRATYESSGHGYDYGSPNPEALACSGRSHHGDTQPGAHTDRPPEPPIRPAQEARFGARVNFLIGYTPDLLGYIVPGYDFAWYGVQPEGLGSVVGQVPDACGDIPPDLAFPEARYHSHYQETNSAGSMLAPAVTCELVRLLGDPLKQANRAACAEWDQANLTGAPPNEEPPFGHEPGCPLAPPQPSEYCLIRHY